MNEQKAILLVTAQTNPEEHEALQAYVSASGELFKAAGAKPLNKFKIASQIIGNHSMDLISILEFPNADALAKVFDDEAYKALLPLRELAFTKLEAYVSNME